MKRARTLICVDSEFTNPNIAAVRLRLDGTGIPKVGRERGEEIDVEKKGARRGWEPGGRENRRIDRHQRIYRTVMRCG